VDGHKLAALVEYDGTGFRGYQLQADGRTVQGELESAIAKLAGVETRVHAASRTDAGVHAVGQVISFWISERFEPPTVVRALNHFLPDDVVVKGACVVDGDFDVRRRAVSRKYTYRVTRDGTRSPLRERYSLFMRELLDLPVMRLAARSLQGVHDFASFATSLEESGCTVRMMHETRVRESGNDVELSFTQNAFLRHQVRNMVGQLLRVGQGRCSVDTFAGLLSNPRIGTAGPAAPARGLCLMEVRYESSLPFAA
jgi:tRNA pseudouridine38-40 synthase